MSSLPSLQKTTPKRLSVIAALTSLSLLATGCADIDSTPPVWPEVHGTNPINELPVGAELLTPSEFLDSVGEAREKESPHGTIRPDAATVEDRVPNIIERGRLVVGVGQYLNRLGFRDPLSGQLEGFEIDLAHEIARDIFGDPNRIEFRYVENRRRESALRSGDVDMVVRTWTIQHERQNLTEFSLPYLAVSTKMLVMKNSDISSLDDLDGKTVCATKDSAPAQNIAETNIGHLLLTRTWTDCLLAMQRSQADAIYSDDAILSGLQAQDPYTELLDTGSDINYYGVGMPAPTTGRNARGLVMQVNKTIERIRADGTWGRLYSEWMQEYLGPAQSLPVNYRDEADDKRLSKQRREWLRDNSQPKTSRTLGTLSPEDFHD